MDWRSKAACLTVDPELFFPIGNTGPAIAQVAEAKAVCRECEVVGICLQWAIDNNRTIPTVEAGDPQWTPASTVDKTFIPRGPPVRRGPSSHGA